MSEQKLTDLEAWQAAIIAYGDGPVTPPATGMPLTRFGVHLIGNREDDLLYIERLRPASVKIVDPDPSVVRRVLKAIDPNGVVILRDHPMSEQKADMARDPTGTGRKHAQDWIAKLTTGRFAEFGKDKRIVVIGINEPDVHNEAEERIVLAYTLAFLQDLTAAGIRGGALNLSVGWPRNLVNDGPPVWDTFRSLESVILKNNGFLITHEYWYPTVQSGWGFYGNRIKHCPFAVPVIIGECAYTRQLIIPPVGQPWGWRGAMSPPAYAESLWWYHDNVDVNVHSIMPFTTGFGGAEWESKDTQPAHADILARKRGYTFPAVWPVKKGEIPPIDPPNEGDKYRLLWPKMDRITQRFSTNHSGLDISMETGTPLYAMASGIVRFSTVDEAANGGYGQYIRINLPDLYFDQFVAHLSRRDVVAGQEVTRGQQIGLSGSTGNSTGPHLHLEIRCKEKDNVTDRKDVSSFSRGQVCPLSVRSVLHGIFGSDER